MWVFDSTGPFFMLGFSASLARWACCNFLSRRRTASMGGKPLLFCSPGYRKFRLHPTHDICTSPSLFYCEVAATSCLVVELHRWGVNPFCFVLLDTESFACTQRTTYALHPRYFIVKLLQLPVSSSNRIDGSFV